MNRRELVLGVAAAGGLAAGCSGGGEPEPAPLASGLARGGLGLDIYFETHGNPRGPNLFLLNPLGATTSVPLIGRELRANKTGFIRQLGDRYHLLIADYPYGFGRSGKLKDGARLTVQQVCADYLAIADAARMERFAVAGYSWGGNSALQLATRSPQVTAVAVGGWPALGGPYDVMLELSRRTDSVPLVDMSNFVGYYASLRGWPEHEEVARLACPRLNYVDTSDDSDILGLKVRLYSRFRRNRAALQALGWETAEVRSGKGHGGGLKPAFAGPVLRGFLDRHYAALAAGAAQTRAP